MYVDNAAMQLIRNPKQVPPSFSLTTVALSSCLEPPQFLSSPAVLQLSLLSQPPSSSPSFPHDFFLQFDVMVTGNIFGDILSDEVSLPSLLGSSSPLLTSPLRPPCSSAPSACSPPLPSATPPVSSSSSASLPSHKPQAPASLSPSTDPLPTSPERFGPFLPPSPLLSSPLPLSPVVSSPAHCNCFILLFLTLGTGQGQSSCHHPLCCHDVPL